MLRQHAVCVCVLCAGPGSGPPGLNGIARQLTPTQRGMLLRRVAMVVQLSKTARGTWLVATSPGVASTAATTAREVRTRRVISWGSKKKSVRSFGLYHPHQWADSICEVFAQFYEELYKEHQKAQYDVASFSKSRSSISVEDVVGSLKRL